MSAAASRSARDAGSSGSLGAYADTRLAAVCLLGDDGSGAGGAAFSGGDGGGDASAGGDGSSAASVDMQQPVDWSRQRPTKRTISRLPGGNFLGSSPPGFQSAPRSSLSVSLVSRKSTPKTSAAAPIAIAAMNATGGMRSRSFGWSLLASRLEYTSSTVYTATTIAAAMQSCATLRARPLLSRYGSLIDSCANLRYGPGHLIGTSGKSACAARISLIS